MDGLGMVAVVGVRNNRSRSTNLSGNLPWDRVALRHWLRVTHLLWNLPGNSMASCAGNWDTNGDGHTVRCHHLSWSAHWHLAAFSLGHLMAERFSMGDGNRTSTDEVTVGRTHQLGVSISIGFPLAKSMTSVASMSMSSNSGNCVSVNSRSSNCVAMKSSSRSRSRSNVSMISVSHSDGLTNH